MTTLDYELQQEAHALVAQVGRPPSADNNVNNSALVAIDSATGEIVATSASVDYYNREEPRVQGQFDVAGLGRRQPGSAFKPITYASAFKSRDATVVDDARGRYDRVRHDRRDQLPADQRRHQGARAGAGDGRAALPLNIPSVQMQYLVGSQTTAEFAETLGIASAEYIMGQDPGLSLALGSVPVNLTNMTQAYTTFANAGRAAPEHDDHRDPGPRQPRRLHPRGQRARR